MAAATTISGKTSLLEWRHVAYTSRVVMTVTQCPWMVALIGFREGQGRFTGLIGNLQRVPKDSSTHSTPQNPAAAYCVPKMVLKHAEPPLPAADLQPLLRQQSSCTHSSNCQVHVSGVLSAPKTAYECTQVFPYLPTEK
jgi:hypothetical protein